jgi:hypothetical protein
MILRVIGTALCIFFFSINSGFGQSVESNDLMIEHGLHFLSKKRIKAWRTLLDEAPRVCGKMSSRFQKRTNFEGWYSKNYVLKIYYDKDGNSRLILSNPKYVAALSINKDIKVNLTNVTPAKSISAGAPFADLSMDLDGTFIPTSLEYKKIEVASFHTQNGHQTIKFVPVRKSEFWESIELQFNDDSGPLPIKYLTKFVDGSSRLYIALDFCDVQGYLLPQKLGIVRSSTSPITLDSKPTEFAEYEYNPGEALEESRCYLTYYGLREPDLKEVADFSRKKWHLQWWIPIGTTGVAVIAVLFWMRKRHASR